MLRSLVGWCLFGWQGCAGRTRFVVGMREVAEAFPTCGQPTARLIDAAPTYSRYPFGPAFGIESYRVLRQMDVFRRKANKCGERRRSRVHSAGQLRGSRNILPDREIRPWPEYEP